MDKHLQKIQIYFDKILPNAKCELVYCQDYELLIAVILSAQTTDKKVNAVTPRLFQKYPSLTALSNASIVDVENIIHSIGLYRNKAKNIVEASKILVQKYHSTVPSTFEDLCSLPGVGRKTANVVRAELFHIPSIAVDTHVERCAKRLGLASKEDNPYQVELKLEQIIPQNRQILFHHQMIHFGRYYCFSRSPHCEKCELKEICTYYKEKVLNV